MATTQPGFEQILSSTLFAVPAQSDKSRWCAYLLGRNDTPPAPPASGATTISFADSFDNYKGHYLFGLDIPVFDDEAGVENFIAAVRTYLDNSGFPSVGAEFNGRACVWIPDVSTPTFGDAASYAFSFGLVGSSNALESDFNNPIGSQLTLSVTKSTYINMGDQGLELKQSPTAGGEVSIISNTFTNYGPSVDKGSATVFLTGLHCGCFQFTGQISTSVTLNYMQAGVRYSHADRSHEESSNESIVGQTYPVLLTSSPGVKMNYAGVIDPLDPTNAQLKKDENINGFLRTILAPLGDSDAVALPSWLRTNVGQSVSLLAQGGIDDNGVPSNYAGGFILECCDGAADNVYMSFAGDFALQIDTATQATQHQATQQATAGDDNVLLTGLSGLEGISFRAYQAGNEKIDRLRFVPACAAYAPIFPFAQANINDPTSGATGARLDSRTRTPWVTIVNGDQAKAQYLAQPEGSPLYAPNGDENIPLLDFFQAPTQLPQTTGFAVPLAIYAGLTNDTDGFASKDIQRYESQIISATRKEKVEKAVTEQLLTIKTARRKLLQAKKAGGTPTTTPQGLLACVANETGGADYQQVTMAKSIVKADQSADFAFVDLEIELQHMFQTNQLFSVVVSPRHLGKLGNGEIADGSEPAFENTITMSGWTMTAEVGDGSASTSYRNVMIFKFCDGKLIDRITNPNKWIAADNFSIVPGNDADSATALTGLSQWLQDYVQEGVAKSVGDSPEAHLYKNFARIVQDESWQGILVLRANVEPSGFPDSIKGLIAGIDFTQFEAHHFGVSVSRVTVTGKDVTMQTPSSMFGLIDYQLAAFKNNIAIGGNPDVPLPMPGNDDYQFSVLQLQALFENAALIEFRSRVQLTTNSLFASKVTKTLGPVGVFPANAVVLKASYQDQGGEPVYIFENDDDTIFEIDSNVLSAVTFNRIQFNTVDPGTKSQQVVSRFLIWGLFNFTEMMVSADNGATPFDALSFGSDNGASLQDKNIGLSYSNLQIMMSSPLSSPNAVTFNFIASNLAFDISASTVRQASLFPTFALEVDSFIASDGSKRPVDFGYLPVNIAPHLQSLSGPWFGVVYKVTMGTPGALVSDAGFTSTMLLAWSPQANARSDAYSMFCGLRLPGAAPGAKLVSIQGVLKLTVGHLQLSYGPNAGSSNVFTLMLGDVGLTFLGIAKLPPGATINFFLFGDPESTGSLGWYAAYNKDQEKKQGQKKLAALKALPEPQKGPVTSKALEHVLAAEPGGLS